MRVLLDENFPLQLHRRLVAAGHDCEHIIVLGQRGLSDTAIVGETDDRPGVHAVLLAVEDEYAGQVQLRTGDNRLRQCFPVTPVASWTP